MQHSELQSAFFGLLGALNQFPVQVHPPVPEFEDLPALPTRTAEEELALKKEEDRLLARQQATQRKRKRVESNMISSLSSKTSHLIQSESFNSQEQQQQSEQGSSLGSLVRTSIIVFARLNNCIQWLPEGMHEINGKLVDDATYQLRLKEHAKKQQALASREEIKQFVQSQHRSNSTITFATQSVSAPAAPPTKRARTAPSAILPRSQAKRIDNFSKLKMAGVAAARAATTPVDQLRGKSLPAVPARKVAAPRSTVTQLQKLVQPKSLFRAIKSLK